ncbi:AraC family transcriptional regulator [Aliivibrio sp. EL58]|uniref:helix-turn-helix domain-containing protein n=1 Tax=Aliivibrio sp. EL58 TaxID=2107582 RepID=UPI000EFD9547|nr:AraC family transcriptional regulator [Aliivibrio sp. EL58]
MNKALYWLGKSIDSLEDKKDIIESEFNIIEIDYDVSIISSSSVHMVAYNFNKISDKYLLNICLNMCINLNKVLLIFHSDTLFIDKDIEQNNHIKINLNENNTTLKSELEKIKINSFRPHIEPIGDHSDILLTKQSEQSNRNILNILKYIDNNLSEQLREIDVADYCHYSITYFSKFFHQETGVSFRDYLCSKRINKAKKLLIEDYNIKIAIIAYQCGYNDVSYFTRIFKKKAGISPGEFRKKTLLNR